MISLLKTAQTHCKVRSDHGELNRHFGLAGHNRFDDNDRLSKIKIKVIRGHEDCVNSAAFFSNDERIISSSSDGTVRIWSSENGRELTRYEDLHAPGTIISKCAINAENNRIITCGWDKRLRNIDAETGAFMWTGDHRGIVTDCNFSHDGKLVVSGSDLDKCFRIWDAANGTLIKEVADLHKSTITKCMFDSKDTRIITTSVDKTCKFWDMKSGINTVTLAAHGNVVSNCAYTENGLVLATCGWDKLIYLWDVTTGMYRARGPKQVEKAHEGCISSVAFNVEGDLLVSGSYDKNVIIWDTAEQTMKLRLQGHEDWITDVSFSKSGFWVLSASRDRTLQLWNIEESDKIPVVAERKKATMSRLSTCSNCRKIFSITMLDESQTPGQPVCVFCRMENRPNIWSVVDQVLNVSEATEHLDNLANGDDETDAEVIVPPEDKSDDSKA